MLVAAAGVATGQRGARRDRILKDALASMRAAHVARERAEARQRERERVADAIHDNLAQDLAAAVISLETAYD